MIIVRWELVFLNPRKKRVVEFKTFTGHNQQDTAGQLEDYLFDKACLNWTMTSRRILRPGEEHD